MSDDELGGFVPVNRAAVRALEEAASELWRARAELREATEELLELSEDMKIDAVRRLVERGASEAQLERYEEAYRRSAHATRERGAALDSALARLRRAIEAIR
ncbi:MAG TPA: hypothetical protein VIL20_30400 [Sandaracinaceae bacterium]